MFNGMKIGVGITGSFCSLSNCLRFLKELKKYPVDIYVFISDQVNSCDTRFFKANQLIIEVEKIIEAMQKEDVTLERIEAEDGGSYHPDQAGTYIATYWVVPKDARDSYSVSRKIILTDTEGQAHRRKWRSETERGYEIRRRFGDACAGDPGCGSDGIRGRCGCTGSKGTGRKD